MTYGAENAEDTCLNNHVDNNTPIEEPFRASEATSGPEARSSDWTFASSGSVSRDDGRSTADTITPMMTAPPPSVITHDGGLHGIVAGTDKSAVGPTYPSKNSSSYALPLGSSPLDVSTDGATPDRLFDVDLEKRPRLMRTGTASRYVDLATAKLSAAGEKLGKIASQATQALTFPEGGLQAWLVVLGSFSAMASVYGVINSAAVFESWFSSHQLADYPPSTIGWIFSLYLFVVFFVGLQVGPIFDAYGPRLVVAFGSIMLSASMALLGQCETYGQIIACYSVLGGLGGALLNPPSYGVIAHYFSARRGFATGVATTAGGLGGIIFPMLLQKLLPSVGFAWSCRVLGLIMLLLAIPTNLLIRTRLPRAKLSGRGAARKVLPDFTVFRDAKFLLCSVGICFMEWGLFVPLTFIVSFAAAHGQEATAAYTLLALLNAGSVVGRFVPGLLADKIGRFNVILGTIALCIATVIGLWLPAIGGNRSVLVAFAVLFGFASGSNLGLVPVCLGQLCDARDYGRYFSSAMMVASFGTLSSVPIGGALLGVGGVDESDKGWLALILFSGVAYCLALACYGAARVLAVGWSLKKIF